MGCRWLFVLVVMSGVVWGVEGFHHNGGFLLDELGNPLHAHGGGVVKVGDYYYYFGENRHLANNRFFAVSCYRSKDLVNWEFRNHVLTSVSDPELGAAKLERPKVVYNAATGKYVMWAHKENASDYTEARAAVAWCDTVDGDYTWVGSFRPFGYMSRDCTLYVDDDGTGYFLSAANNNYDLHLYRLTEDYLGAAELVTKIWVGGHREAPCLFKRGDYYFIVSSGATGWNPNQGKYGWATSLAGPWSGLYNLGNSTTYRSQPHYVLAVEGTEETSYLYMGDRWAGAWGGPVNYSRYVWLELEFSGATGMAMPWRETLVIDAAAGTIGEPPAAGWTKVDDSDGRVGYSTGWGIWQGNPGYQQTEHYSEVTGSEATFTFEGTAARWYGFRRSDLGYAGVYVDGERVATVDCYGANGQYDVLLYETGPLAEGTHTLVVRVEGMKHPSSSGTEVIVDAFAWDAGGMDGSPALAGGQEYRIVSRLSGKVLTVDAADATEAGAAIVQHTDTGEAWQRWRPVGLGDGTFRLENSASGLCLDVAGAGAENSRWVVQRAWSGAGTQRWRLAERADGLWQIVSGASGEVLDVSDASVEDGAQVLVYGETGGLNQRWLMEAGHADRWESEWLQAEGAAGQEEFGPWTVQAGGVTAASGSIALSAGAGLQSSPVVGVAEYGFELEKRGRVKLWLVAEAPDAGANSVWVRWGGGAWGEVELPVDGQWGPAYGGGRVLEAGGHGVSLAWREGGVGIDALRLGLRLEPAGDLTDDGEVGVADLAVLGENWLGTGEAGDVWPAGGDGLVNCYDWAVLQGDWWR